MKHLGDITKISGYDVPPVDVVIGGSPCQDLSVAGKRAGLSGARSGLFMEQIRIIKEMREADVRRGRTGQFIRPRFMVWENVPGAFSSNKGDDFRAVLEETIKVEDPDVPDVPLPPKGKWPMADCWYGDGWSVAYRVLDAQFWGVPQRRRRIALVADFGGHAAPEILFVKKCLHGHFTESGTSGEETAARTRSGSDSTVWCLQGNVVDREAKMNGIGISGEPMFTLNTVDKHAIAIPINTMFRKIRTRTGGNVDTVISFQERAGKPGGGKGILIQENRTGALSTLNNQYVFDARGNGDGKTVCTLTGDHQNRVTDYTSVVVEPLPFDTTQITSPLNRIHPKYGDPCHPLAAGAHPPAIAVNTYPVADGIVRRLTPLECERLQGFPDNWTDIGAWTDSKGKIHKESNDSARYKALGNSIALPPWKFVLKRLCAQYERDATMASLFDGIGGFPLIWERLNGPGTCLWASEIEEFPIAVTKFRFPT